MENLKSMYPRGIRVIQSYVSEVCDRMDYQNSPMYDEWPEQRIVDQMCNLVCEAASVSGDMDILRDTWDMQEKKTIKKMSVEEEREELYAQKKEMIGTGALKDEENKRGGGKEETEDAGIEGTGLRTEEVKIHKEENTEEAKIQEDKNYKESDMEEDIHQVTADADRKEHDSIIESQEMSPPLRRWWNGWGINGIGPDVQGMACGMGPMYAPFGLMGAGNSLRMQGQEMRRPPQGPGPVRPPYPPQGPGPVRPPYPPQSPGPVRPPYPSRPPYPPHHPNPSHSHRPGIYPVWFRDIVKTLILDEMQNRRCRRGMCIR